MIEHASLLAILIAGIALFALIYVALFMRTEDPQPQKKLHPKEHVKRWEDRL